MFATLKPDSERNVCFVFVLHEYVYNVDSGTFGYDLGEYLALTSFPLSKQADGNVSLRISRKGMVLQHLCAQNG